MRHKRSLKLFATPTVKLSANKAGNYQAPTQPASNAHKAILTEDGRVILDQNGNAILVE